MSTFSNATDRILLLEGGLDAKHCLQSILVFFEYLLTSQIPVCYAVEQCFFVLDITYCFTCGE